MDSAIFDTSLAKDYLVDAPAFTYDPVLGIDYSAGIPPHSPFGLGRKRFSPFGDPRKR
jgi:hypothetical protein